MSDQVNALLRRIVGFQVGDRVRFKPKDDKLWDLLAVKGWTGTYRYWYEKMASCKWHTKTKLTIVQVAWRDQPEYVTVVAKGVHDVVFPACLLELRE